MAWRSTVVLSPPSLPPPPPASILYGTEKYCIPLLNQPLHPRQYLYGTEKHCSPLPSPSPWPPCLQWPAWRGTGESLLRPYLQQLGRGDE